VFNYLIAYSILTKDTP